MHFDVSSGTSSKELSASRSKVSVRKSADGTFRQKEHGISYQGKKAVDSFELQIENTSLPPASLSSAKLWGLKFFHRFKTLEVEITDFPVADGTITLASFRNLSDKRQHLSLKTLLTLADRFGPHKRVFDQIRQALVVHDTRLFLTFGLGKIEKDVSLLHPYARDKAMHHVHTVHTREQLEPYTLSFALEGGESFTLPFVLAFSSVSADEALDNYDHISNDWKGMHLDVIQETQLYEKIETQPYELNRAFHWSAHLLRQLPDHDALLTRQDVLWLSLALLDLGEYTSVERMIHALKGKDPLLFFFIATTFAEHTGDDSFLHSLRDDLTWAKKQCVLENSVVRSTEEGSTVDSLNWLSSSLEQQSLWSEALKTTYLRTSHLLKKTLENEFWDEGNKMVYTRPLSSRSVNADAIDSRFLLPLAFGQVAPEKAHATLNDLKRNYSSMHGIFLKPRSAKTGTFFKETAFSTLTGIAACSFFRYDRPDDGLRMLLDLTACFEKGRIGHIAENYSVIDGSPRGRSFNVAAHALLIHAIDSYLFGFKTHGERLIVEPKMPSEWSEMKRKHKLSGNTHISFSMHRVSACFEGEIKLDGKKKEIVELIFPPHIKEINVNGQIQKGHTILFRPDELTLFTAKI